MSLFSALPEDFLHFVWRNRHFSQLQLFTTAGEPIRIFSPGIWNHDQGPDFSQAQIRIGSQSWMGQVEIHLHSRDWYQHGHDADPQYNHTILHVVLHSDGRPVFRADGTKIPELVLEQHLRPTTVQLYTQFLKEGQTIPCQNLLPHLSDFERRQVLGRMSVERLETKTDRFQARLDQTTQNWEQVLWEELLVMMGGPVNGPLFRELGERLPFQLIRQYAYQALTVEALLFGAAGSLPSLLQVEQEPTLKQYRMNWAYLSAKHKLVPASPLPFRFSRMRPAQFPTIRLSQMARLVQAFPILTDLLLDVGWQRLLQIELGVSAYWQKHSRWGQVVATRPRCLGQEQKEKLLSNVCLPLGNLYARAHGRQRPDLFESMMSSLVPENNRITRKMTSLGFPNESAFDTQGLLHLYKQYCQQKRCLHCQIGQKLLHNSKNLVPS